MIIRYCLLFIFSFGTFTLRAQGSIAENISLPYLDTLIAAAKANYPRVKSYEHRVNIAELNVQRAKLDWFNIVSLTYLYNPATNTTLLNPNTGGQTSNNNFLVNGYQVGVSTSIGSILEKPGAVKTAREQLEIAKNEQDEYSLNLEAMVKQRYFVYLEQAELLKWRSKSLETAESAVQDSKYKFEKGEVTFEVYNRVLGNYSNAVQMKIEAEGLFLVAKSSLEEIIGTKLDKLNNGIQ